MHASHGAFMQASQLPLCKCGMPEITYGHAVHSSQIIFIKTFKAPCQCSGWMKMQVNHQMKIADDGKLTIAQ